jgi:16S rRNA (cytosine1402-N4)-methyltransferase
MRYGVFAGERTAADLVNRWSEPELERRIRELGGERFAKRIAAAIVRDRRARKFSTTGELARTISNAVSKGYERGRIHPATRTFQALRIVVNRELENLNEFLAALPSCVAPGGRVAIISFQSLEDALVKTAFKTFATSGIATPLSKKPIMPTLAERRANPRSRSAKLRVVRFLDPLPKP